MTVICFMNKKHILFDIFYQYDSFIQTVHSRIEAFAAFSYIKIPMMRTYSQLSIYPLK